MGGGKVAEGGGRLHIILKFNWVLPLGEKTTEIAADSHRNVASDTPLTPTTGTSFTVANRSAIYIKFTPEKIQSR